MTYDEFKEFLRDRMSNACHDPMGFEAAVDEISGQWQRDVEKAHRSGQTEWDPEQGPPE
jgi:hypothetical protein